jgi:hypothetical protein
MGCEFYTKTAGIIIDRNSGASGALYWLFHVQTADHPIGCLLQYTDRKL